MKQHNDSWEYAVEIKCITDQLNLICETLPDTPGSEISMPSPWVIKDALYGIMHHLSRIAEDVDGLHIEYLKPKEV